MNKSREIKFRVWDAKYKDWMRCGFLTNGVGNFIAGGGKGYHFQTILNNETLTDKIHEEIPFNGSNPRWTVQQYTGLKDILGKDIFEGDIVKYKRHWGSKNGRDSHIEISIDEIYFSDAGWYPQPETRIEDDSYYNYKQYDFEVIGNIFQNPKLLKSDSFDF